jgi:hypothetical protein
MIDRRAFIQHSAALLCGTLLSPAPLRMHGGERVLRVGTIIDPDARELDAGLTFGTDESSRSASLFGWRVERLPLEPGNGRDLSPLHALVVGTRADTESFQGPVLSTRCDLAPTGAFVLAPCAADTSDGARVVVWHESLERFGAEQLNDRYRAATQRPMSGDAWLGWFAMKVLAEAALRSRSVAPAVLTNYLARAAFDGHKGSPLAFDAHRRLQQPLYVLERTRASGAWIVRRELAPVPTPSGPR